MKKTAIITGSGRGMGFETAKELEKNGYAVVLCARHGNEETQDFVRQHPDTAVFLQADISREEDRRRLLCRTEERFGRLDLLVNNAGVAPRTRKDMLEITEEEFDYVMNINLKGTYFLTQQAAGLIAKQGGGYIVNTGSISADTVSLNRAEYCLSKAGISMLTKLLAVRLAPLHIGVFEIRPGVIDTDMIAPVREKYRTLAENGTIPCGRLGTVKDFAGTVLAIASGGLDYATGTVIQCGGGLHIPTL